MSSSSSQFYPPRARGLGRLRAMRFAIRRIFYAKPAENSWGAPAIVFGYVVPGYVFRMFGYPLLSGLAMAAYAGAAVIFLIALGFPWGNRAFAFMLALHTLSVLLLVQRFIGVESFKERLVRSAGILFLVITAYLGLQALFGKVIMPLRYEGRVYVVNGLASAKRVKRGERIVYRIAATHNGFRTSQAHGTVIVEEGFGFGNVLALPGDRIEFTKESCLVNDVKFPLEPRMPQSGTLVVPQNHWFIWPDFAISIQGTAARMQAEAMLLRMGMVPKEDFAGRIFGHWFWRKQL